MRKEKFQFKTVRQNCTTSNRASWFNNRKDELFLESYELVKVDSVSNFIGTYYLTRLRK